MSEEDWTIVSKPVVTASKWEDEEDSDVKENWDDDEEEVSKASSTTEGAAQTSQPEAPKPAAKKKKQKALKEKLLQKDLEMQRPKTQEELLAEKLERQRLQEESDLALAKDTFGIDSVGIDPSVFASLQLSNRQDFESFRKALSTKLSAYARSPFYVPFLEEFFRDLTTDLEADDIKKLDTVLTTLFNEKIKIQKQLTKGKKAPKKNAEIRMERDDDYSYNQGGGGYDDFDDFL